MYYKIIDENGTSDVSSKALFVTKELKCMNLEIENTVEKSKDD